MLKKGVVLSWMLVFLTAGIASAYRPLATEDAGVAGKGIAQAEVSWDNIKWKNGDKEDIFLFVPIYGLTENLELSVEIPYLYHSPDSAPSEEGTGDICIVAKYLLIPGGTEGLAFAVKGVVKMDNGDYDKGLGSGDKDYSIMAGLSRMFIDRWSKFFTLPRSLARFQRVSPLGPKKSARMLLSMP